MKRLAFIILLSLPLVVLGQKYEYRGIKNFPVSSETGKVSYDSVVALEGKSAEQLYKASKEWIARSYPDSKEIIQVDNLNERIIGKGTLRDNYNNLITYNFILDFKDGRYRYQITDIINHFSTGSISLEEYTKPSKNKTRHSDRLHQDLNNQLSQTALAFSKIASLSPKQDW